MNKSIKFTAAAAMIGLPAAAVVIKKLPRRRIL